MTEQVSPTTNECPPMWEVVIQDMDKRNVNGIAKYRVPLQPFNGRDALQDAYEECLDMAVYLRQCIWERDNAVPRDAYNALVQKLNQLSKDNESMRQLIKSFGW